MENGFGGWASCGAGFEEVHGVDVVVAAVRVIGPGDAVLLVAHSRGSESGKQMSIGDADDEDEDWENTGSMGVGGTEKSVSIGLVGGWLSRGSPAGNVSRWRRCWLNGIFFWGARFGRFMEQLFSQTSHVTCP